MAGLSLRNVSKRFGSVEVIPDLSLEIADGEFAVFVGPSGCGKSTLLRMIAGLEALSGGEIHIGPSRIDAVAPGDRGVAMVFQHYALYPHMTVRQNVAFGLRNIGTPADEIARKIESAAGMLEIVPLLERKPAQLSGGQRQRVAIARAFLKDAPLLILDEATSHLDTISEQAVRAALDALMADRTTIVVAHRLSTIRAADLILVLRGGTVIEAGPHATLLAHDGVYKRLVEHQMAGVAA